MYGMGWYVGAELKGRMIDWEKGLASGTVDATGEEGCIGESNLRKIK